MGWPAVSCVNPCHGTSMLEDPIDRVLIIGHAWVRLVYGLEELRNVREFEARVATDVHDVCRAISWPTAQDFAQLIDNAQGDWS